METAKQRIEEIKIHGYEIDFGTTFNHAFEIYKKIAVNAGLVFLMLCVGFCIVGGAFFGMAALNLATFNEQMLKLQPETMSLTGILTYLGAIIVGAALLSPVNAGIIKMAYHAETNRPFSVTTAFEYYRSAYFSDLAVAAVIIAALGGGLNLMFQYIGLSLIGIIITYTISLFTVITMPLIIFGNLKALEAIQASVIIVSKNPLVILGLIIVAALAAMVGLIAFCIGVVFTVPIIYAMYTVSMFILWAWSKVLTKIHIPIINTRGS